MADTPTLREAATKALEAIEPVMAYGRFGTRDVEQAELQKAHAALRAALAEQAAEQAEPVAPHLSYPHITQPYTLEEIRAQIASHDYSAELLLQHAMLLLDDAEQAEPVADWSVFNTGAEVAGGLTYAEALEYLTPPRLERGWSAVCVVNKDNIPAAPAEGGAA